MKISNGIDIDSSWVDSIAVSRGGDLWANLNSENLTVRPQSTTARDGSQKFKIIILDGKKELEFFFLSEVDNQPTWTNDIAGLVVASNDIATWINRYSLDITGTINGLATETTLADIKAKTDLLNFTGVKLRTTGEDSGGGGGTSVFGDTGGYANILPNGLDQLVLASDTDFKEVILYHENKKQGWIKLGGGAAVVGEGFPIKKKQPWILDRCRDEIRIIFESGFDAKKLQINTTIV